MSNTTTSNYMSLPVPIPTVDPGPDYAVNLNSCLTLIDQHNHASGAGQQITPSGISINADLPFNTNNATLLRSARFVSQGSPIATASDLTCIYVSGGNLYYNDNNSNQIQLTANGAVVTPPGSITNLIAPASVTYVSATQTFIFRSSSAVSANIDAGSYTLRNLTTGSSGLTFSAPNSVTNYTWTVPTANTVSSSAYLTITSAGQIGYTSPSQNGNVAFATQIIASSSQGVAQASLTNGTYAADIGNSMVLTQGKWRVSGYFSLYGGSGAGTFYLSSQSGFYAGNGSNTVGQPPKLTGTSGFVNVINQPTAQVSVGNAIPNIIIQSPTQTFCITIPSSSQTIYMVPFVNFGGTTNIGISSVMWAETIL